jgi:hypothetical protein
VYYDYVHRAGYHDRRHGKLMAAAITIEIILDNRTLHLIRDLDLNLPQSAIEGILAAIDREMSIKHVVSAASTQTTIQELTAALTAMREQRDLALQAAQMVPVHLKRR